MSRRYAALVLVLGLALVAAAIAIAAASEGVRSADGAITNASSTHGHHQHGDIAGHLPASSENVRRVSKLRLKNVVPDKIADVGVWNGHAYLAAWGGAECKYNGVHVVDIRNVAAPKEVAFIQAKEGSAPGEGIQALRIDTPSFTGDVLVSNNEKCKDKTGFGGLNIYDVSRPGSPTVLAEGFGDETVKGQGKKAANDIHSVFAWDAGSKAYAVIVDNEEGPDVDIVDISNPKKPSDGRRVRPRRDVSTDRRRRSGESRRDLPSRHGREGDRRPFPHARVVLGRGLRRARRHRSRRTRRTSPTRTSRRSIRSSSSRRVSLEAPEGNAHEAEFTTTTSTSSPPTRTSAPRVSVARRTTAARSSRRRVVRRPICTSATPSPARRATSVAPAPVTPLCPSTRLATKHRGRLARPLHLHREDRGHRARGVRRSDRREPRGLRRMRAVRDDRRGRHPRILGRAERRLRFVRRGRVRQRRVPCRHGRAAPRGVALGEDGRHGHADGVLRRLGLRPPLSQRAGQAAGAGHVRDSRGDGSRITPRASATSPFTRRLCRRRSTTASTSRTTRGASASSRSRTMSSSRSVISSTRAESNFWGVQVFSPGRQGVLRGERHGVRPVHLRVHGLNRPRDGVRVRRRTPSLDFRGARRLDPQRALRCDHVGHRGLRSLRRLLADAHRRRPAGRERARDGLRRRARGGGFRRTRR